MASDDPLFEMIGRIAVSLGSEYETDVDDVSAEIHIWCLENQQVVDALLEHQKMGLLYHRLSSVGRRWCAKERAQALGYDPNDIIQYNIRAIRELLPDVFNYEDWQPSGREYDGMPRAKPMANAGMDRVAMLIDIKTAMMRLPEDQYNVVVWVYKYGYTADQLAAELGVTLEAAQKRIQRAVKRIQSLLTEVRPMEVPQRRTVVSNAAARAIQSGHYEE